MKKYALFIPIGFKLTGIVSLILGISLGGLTVLSTLRFTEDIERTLRTNTLERAELLSEKIQGDIDSAIGAGRLLAATLQGGLVYSGTGGAPAEELLAQNGRILAIGLLERKDGSISETAQVGETRIVSFSSMLKIHNENLSQAFAGETVILNLSPEAGIPLLGIAFPFSMRSDSEADTVAFLEIDGEPFITALSARELYVNFLVDAEGTLLAHTDRELMIARPSFAANAIVRDSLSAGTDLKQLKFEGEGGDWIGTWKRTLDGKVSVISTVHRNTALANVFILQRTISLITAMILCVSMFLLFFFSRSLTHPIQKLMEGAQRISDGDFSVSIERSSRDEIGRLSQTFNSMAIGLAERDRIKSTFGKFVNKEVAERLLSGEIQLGGESLQAAIFFSDIRSFTAMSEKLTPHDVVEFLNDYMTRMVSCVNATHGVVDKFIGDAIMATWGVPYSRGNDTENAINSALLMRKALSVFNREREAIGLPAVRIGSGINTGEVIAGQIGSLERMEYTCIGDAVNLASRIESLNKAFKTDILVSEYSLGLVRDIFRVEPMNKIRVKGKSEAQQIYAILGRRDDPACPSSIEELRLQLGLESVDLSKVNADVEEAKYEIIE